MRGKEDRVYGKAHAEGITPAYAGKSLQKGRQDKFRRDHPRVCGEKPLVDQHFTQIPGSPPRMRGKGRCHHLVILVYGITPAYAGKSVFHGFGAVEIQDHPRVCGEKPLRSSATRCGTGSPPRMRGKGGKNKQTALCMGITPAYAGKRTFTRSGKERR